MPTITNFGDVVTTGTSYTSGALSGGATITAATGFSGPVYTGGTFAGTTFTATGGFSAPAFTGGTVAGTTFTATTGFSGPAHTGGTFAGTTFTATTGFSGPAFTGGTFVGGTVSGSTFTAGTGFSGPAHTGGTFAGTTFTATTGFSGPAHTGGTFAGTTFTATTGFSGPAFTGGTLAGTTFTATTGFSGPAFTGGTFVGGTVSGSTFTAGTGFSGPAHTGGTFAGTTFTATTGFSGPAFTGGTVAGTTFTATTGFSGPAFTGGTLAGTTFTATTGFSGPAFTGGTFVGGTVSGSTFTAGTGFSGPAHTGGTFAGTTFTATTGFSGPAFTGGTVAGTTFTATTGFSGPAFTGGTLAGTTFTATTGFSGPAHTGGTFAGTTFTATTGFSGPAFTGGTFVGGAISGSTITAGTGFSGPAHTGGTFAGTTFTATTGFSGPAFTGGTITGGLTTIIATPTADANTLTVRGSTTTGNVVQFSNTTNGIFIFTSAGRVGIGLTNPVAPFHVYWGTGGVPATSGSSDTAIAHRIHVGNIGIDTGVYQNGYIWVQPRWQNDYSLNYGITFCPNGGSIGIGTTSPGYALDIGRFDAATYSMRLASASTVTGTMSTSIRMMEASDGYGFTFQNISGYGFYIQRHSNDVTGTPIITMIRDNPYVGIGTTNNLSTTLTVYKPSSSSTYTGTAAWGNIHLMPQGAENSWAGISFGASSVGVIQHTTQATISVDSNSTTGTNMRFNVGYLFASGALERFTIIGQTGNVGIATSAPQNRLHVSGGRTRCVAGGEIYALGVSYSEASGGIYWIGASNSATPDLIFSQGGGSERMRITNGGFVGINTASPTYPLTVSAIQAATASTTAYYFNTGGGFTLSGSTIWNVGIFSTYYVASGSGFIAFSDERIKKNVSNIDNSIDIINKLRPINYNYIDRGMGTHKKTGFIAQEVNEILPDAVNMTKGIIPNIYKLATSITPTSVTLEGHGLVTGDKVKLISNVNGSIETIVTSVDGATFTIKDDISKETNIFVFGKEVDDCLHLEYDHIFTIGIAAIQELSTENSELKTQMANMDSRLAALEKIVNSRV